MSETNFKYSERLYFAASDKNFQTVHSKSEVWKYFKKNSNNECRCGLCGAVYMQLGQSTANMFKHLNVTHGEQVFGFYRVKKVEEGVFTDFLEDIIAAGYPAQVFLQTMMRLFNCYEKQFHKITKQTGKKMRKARSQIDQILNSMELFTDKQGAEQILRENLPYISEGSRKALLDENFWMFGDDTQIIEHFRKFGYRIHTDCEMKNIYDNMLLVTDKMKEAYFRYGENMSINHIDKVFKKRCSRGFDQISCWFFTGVNQNLEIVLFGFALISQATFQSYKFIFSNFFRVMQQVYPLSICTPQLSKLQSTLQLLCPNTLIVTNWYHKIRYLKELLQEERESQTILRSMCEMLQTPCEEEYKDIMTKIKSKIADQQILKVGIEHQNQKHCICKMCVFNVLDEEKKEKSQQLLHKNYKYLGYSIQARQYLNIEKLIRSDFVYQENLARLLIFVLKLDLKLNSPTSLPFLSKFYNISNNLIQRWELTSQLQGELILQRQNQISFKVFEKHSEKYRKVYWVNFLIEYNHWACNCGYLAITGLPCKHLVIVLNFMGGSIEYYINSRWKLEQNNQYLNNSKLEEQVIQKEDQKF